MAKKIDENKKDIEEQKKFNKAKKQELKHTKETKKELLSQKEALNELLRLQKVGVEAKKEILGMSRDLAKFSAEEAVKVNENNDLIRSHEEIQSRILKDKILRKSVEEEIDHLTDQGTDKSLEIAKNLQTQLDTTGGIAGKLNDELATRKSINKHLGLTDNIMRGLEQIPFFKEFVDGPKIINKAENAIKGMEDESRKSAAGMSAAFWEAYEQIKENASAVGKAVTAWTFTSAIKGVIELSTQITKVQKALNLSDKAARQLDVEFYNMSVHSRATGISVSDIRNNFLSLNEQLGIMTDSISLKKINEEMVILAKYTNLSVEAQGRFAQDVILSGKKAHIITKEARATVEAQSKQFGLGVHVNKILDEAGKITGVMAANFGYSIERMAKALTISKQLGVSLEQTKGIQSGMLDFQTSIENELAAELFTNKQLNLEKARLYALTNDYTNLQKEIVKQFPSVIEFERMNYFAKERTAAALGLTADSMADILRDGKSNLQLAEEAKAAGEHELANSYEKQSIAEQFANTQQKIKESLVEMTIIILPFVETLAKALSHTKTIFTFLGLIAGIKLLGLINSVRLLARAMRAKAITAAIAKAAATPWAIPVLIAGMATAGYVAGSIIDRNTPSKNDLSPMDVAEIQKGEVRAHRNESIIRTDTLEALLNKAGGGNQQQNIQPVVVSVNYSGFDAVKAPTHYKQPEIGPIA